MGTLRFFEEVVSFKIRRTFGFADYSWQMKYFGSPYAITASTVDIGTAELEKILREYLQASREKSAAN